MSYFSVKVCLLGDTNVGKSSIALRFVENFYDDKVTHTVGAAYLWKTVQTKKGSVYKLNIWDTAGQERFKSITPMYYRGATVVVVVYNVAERSTLTRGAREWIESVRRNCSPGVEIVLVGNKADLDVIREVSEDEARRYAEEIGASFYEASAKTGLNVKKIFTEVCSRFEEMNNRHLTLICEPKERRDRTISVITETGQPVSVCPNPYNFCCE